LNRWEVAYVATMMCRSCKIFLHDFLPFALPNDCPFLHTIHKKSFERISSELSDIFVRLSQKLFKKDFEKAWEISNRIARRGRPAQEYQALLMSSTLNLLRISNPWLSSELSHIPCLLMEAGVVRCKDRKQFNQAIWDFINYLIPLVLRCVYEVHDDHVNPKGIYTQVGSIRQYVSKEDERDKVTLYDKDDYMSEILNEADDLYT
jgi:hypothetical protein